MGYPWENWHQQISYDWKGFMKLFAYKPRWENPVCDVPPGLRRLNTEIAGDSQPVEWPAELSNLTVDIGPPRQKPYQGSVGGQPIQMVSRKKMRLFTIDNKWGGVLVRDGEIVGETKAGERYEILVPRPIREDQDGWAVQGYPNMLNTGDRHWYGIEEDGTAHECIWLGIGTDTMSTYCRYAPDGSLLDGIVDSRGTYGVVKGNVQWTSIAWNRGDPPHRLGLAFYNLAASDIPGFSDGDNEEWTTPAYGQLYRLSERAYDRMMETADEEQQDLLVSGRFNGFMPFDRGGSKMGGGMALVSGSQWGIGGQWDKPSTLEDLDIRFSDLELVI